MIDTEPLIRSVDKELAKVVANMPTFIHRKLEKHVAEVLGFCQDRYCGDGGWEIDHCNGRESLVSSFIEDRAKQIANDSINKIITEKVVDEAVGKARESIRSEIDEQVNRQVKKVIYTLLDERVKKMIEDVINERTEAVRETVAKTIDEAISKLGTDADVLPELHEVMCEQRVSEMIDEE